MLLWGCFVVVVVVVDVVGGNSNVTVIFMHTKEGNVLFNNALNTFYLRLYGVRYMVKDHSERERGGKPDAAMGYCFRLAARVFYMHHPTDG